MGTLPEVFPIREVNFFSSDGELLRVRRGAMSENIDSLVKFCYTESAFMKLA